ncbi:MAG: hypothetical protein ABEJ55_01590 [Halanaeroarchaeum sp.]
MNTDQRRHLVAVVSSIGLTAVLLYVLNALAPGLTTGTVFRDTLALVGTEGSQFEAYSDVWLAVRATVGLYIVGVVSGISVLGLLSVRERRTEGEVS